MDERKTGAQMAEELTDFINSAMPDQEKEFVETLMREHRTLQADTFRLFVLCIHGWAVEYNEGRWDERNGHTCKTSHDIVEKIF